MGPVLKKWGFGGGSASRKPKGATSLSLMRMKCTLLSHHEIRLPSSQSTICAKQ